MPTQLDGLQTEEKQLIFDAIPLVTILIAGSDGKIDTREVEWATKLTTIRGYKESAALSDLYKKVGETFEERLKELIEKLPGRTETRQQEISEELAKLNTVLPKIDSWYAKLYYESLLSLAKHVAEASGGILGFMTIDSKESDLIELAMINKL